MDRERNMIRYFLWVLGCFVLLVWTAETIAADEKPNVFVINSDASVEKYTISQTEFVKSITYSVNVVDLGKKSIKAADVEELIYDEDPDLIYCIGVKAYVIARKFAEKTPLVFSSILNWRRLPMDDKTYGVSNEFRAEMEMMWFRYIFPDVQKIGVLYSQEFTEEWFKASQKTAKEIGIELVGREVSKKKAPGTELAKLLEQVDAFWLISDPVLMSDTKDLAEILKRCDDAKIPVFSYHEAFIKFGAVLTVSADTATIGRQAASMATGILSGGEIGEHVQYPAGSYIILNVKKVNEYGLRYNEDSLDSINRIEGLEDISKAPAPRSKPSENVTAQTPDSTFPRVTPYGMTVDNLVVCSHVSNREPVGIADEFSRSQKQHVYTWMEVSDVDPPRTVTHIYYWEGKPVFTINLNMTHSSMRTWSKKSLHTRGSTGKWKVVVTTEQQDEVLAVKEFTVVP